MIMLANAGRKGEPIETPSICLWRCPLSEKIVLVHESSISFFSVRLVNFVDISLSS